MAAILVTRPEPGASATVERLRDLGHLPLAAPLFTVHSVQWSPPGETFDALMLTSANALRLAGPLPDRWRALPCYAVGKATAAAAGAQGFAHVITGDANAEALAAHMAKDGVESALRLVGREHRAIPAAPFHLISRIVYASEPVERLDAASTTALASGAIDHVLLYSARAAAHFAALFDAAGLDRLTTGIGALSPAIATAAGPGWRQIRVAATPTEDQLFAACDLLCDKPVFADRGTQAE